MSELASEFQEHYSSIMDYLVHFVPETRHLVDKNLLQFPIKGITWFSPNSLGQRSIYDNGTFPSEKVLLQETMPSGKNAKNCAIMAKCLKISTHLPPKDYST